MLPALKYRTSPEAWKNFNKIKQETLRLFLPPKKLTISQWAKEKRILSSEDSSQPGRWQSLPFQDEMMDEMCDPFVTKIVMVLPSQVAGKTQMSMNALGYYVDHDPSPILMVQYSVDTAEKWSKTRLAPMIRDNPCLRDKISDPKSRTSNNTILQKNFLGGTIIAVGSNAPAGLASLSIRILILDEVDRYETSAGTEGDPVELAIKRTETYDNRKIIMLSSPGNKATSRIWPEFEETDMRYFHVPCPICGEFQTLIWEQLKFPDRNPEHCFYQCIHCESHLTETDKYKMIPKGIWIPAHPERKNRPGFHLNALYSLWANTTWSNLVEEFLKARKAQKEGNQELMKVFKTTRQALPWENDESDQDPNSLEARAYFFFNEIPPVLPSGCLVLTCGVDTQDNRLELELSGWGLGEQNWTLQYKVIYGNPALNNIWEELFIFLQKKFKHTSGIDIPILRTLIDSGGHHTDNVYEFVKDKADIGIFASKGVRGYGAPILGKPSVNNKYKIPLQLIGVNAAKEKIFTRLKNITEPGAGYINFNKQYCDIEYFRQLLSEKLMKRWNRGQVQLVYEKLPGRRNEALDVKVLNLAAMYSLNPDFEEIAKSLSGTYKPEEEDTIEIKTSRRGGDKFTVGGWK